MPLKLKVTFSIIALAVCLGAKSLCAQGTAFTYQGRLNDGAAPADGSYDFRFQLASGLSGDNLLGDPIVASALPVSGGWFAVTLDFGAGVFVGSNYWLQIEVKTNGAGVYLPLTPRQLLTPSPYAIMASSASNLLGTVSSANLSGTYTGAVTFNNSSNSFSGLGVGLTDLNASQITAGTIDDARLPNTITSDITGHAATAAMAGLVTNGDLSINVDAIPQFETALRYSNQISIVVFGDSVGLEIWRALPRMMDSYSSFPTAGGALRYNGYGDGWGGWVNGLNSGIGQDSADFDSAFDIWWGGRQIYVVTNGTTNVWSTGTQYNATGKLNGNLLKFWYLAAATNGTILVETSTDGTTWMPQILQDQSIPARGLICTNIPLATADYYVRVSAASGRCQYIWPQIVNTNARAFHLANLFGGGASMGELLKTGTNNLATLLTNIWPSPTMIVYCDSKDVFTYTNWPGVKWLFDTFTPNADVVLGKPQPSTVASVESDPAYGTYYQALVFNEIARTNKIPFIDSRSSFADTNRSARLGYYADFIHLNENGQDALSEDFWNRLKIPSRLIATRNFVFNGLNLTNATGWSSFKVLDTANPTRRLLFTNGWSAERMAIYFANPDASAANWNIAGDGGILGFKSPSGLYFYTASDYSGGGRWHSSGGLTLWGGSFNHVNDDPGRGGLIVSGNRTNYGIGQSYGTEYMDTAILNQLDVKSGFITNNGLIWYSTNDTPSVALPNGSICTVSDGRFYIRSNNTWNLK